MTTFYRCNEDNKWWWHWHPKCVIFKGRSQSKKRGKTWVSLVVVSGWPTTYHLCPGCYAEHTRRVGKDRAVYVKREIMPKVTYSRDLAPTFTRNPVTTVEVRRDEAY